MGTARGAALRGVERIMAPGFQVVPPLRFAMMACPPHLARKACRKQRVPQQRKQLPARTGFDFRQITKPPARIAKAFDFSQHNKAFDCSKITKPPGNGSAVR